MHERPLTIAQAAKLYPSGTNVQTVVRHITRGIKTPFGVVKLEASKYGGRWTTTEEAIRRFRDRLTVESRGTPPPASASRAHQLAKAHLDSLGI